MAEETSGIQNKWLLIIALALGFIAVMIYNVHIQAIKRSLESDVVEVVRVLEDLAVGDRVTADAIEKTEIPRPAAQAVGDVVLWKNRQQILRDAGYNVKRPVDKNELLLWTDVSGTIDRRREIAPPGTIRKPLNIETDESPGESLQRGDYINILGIFSPPGSPTKYYRVIEGVPVTAVGGVVADEDDDRARRSARRMRSYRRIEIAVSKDVSEQLSNLETHRLGDWKLEVQRVGENLPPNHGQINPVLKPLAAKARVIEGPRAPSPSDEPTYAPID
jgi:hypothetical protein